ncbi:MAG: hypothetical protein WB421_17895, partial [Terriglobales bacterium]
MEKKVVESDIYRSHKGLWAGFIIAVLCVVAGFTLVVLGHDAWGGLTTTGSLATLVGVFIYGTVSRQRERT